jgi:hypothetical protein
VEHHPPASPDPFPKWSEDMDTLEIYTYLVTQHAFFNDTHPDFYTPSRPPFRGNARSRSRPSTRRPDGCCDLRGSPRGPLCPRRHSTFPTVRAKLKSIQNARSRIRHRSPTAKRRTALLAYGSGIHTTPTERLTKYALRTVGGLAMPHLPGDMPHPGGFSVPRIWASPRNNP